MGPRSIDRGKDGSYFLTVVANSASMGPRSIDRGKGNGVGRIWVWSWGFNGAGIDRSRKAASSTLCHAC